MAPSARINVALARSVHQAVKDVLERDETLVSFIEARCMEEVHARKKGHERAPYTEEALRTRPAEIHPVNRSFLAGKPVPPIQDLPPAPPSELDELKRQLRELTETVSQAITLPGRATTVEERPPFQAAPRAEATGFDPFEKAAAPEMVIDWNLVPENVPDGSRLITEADDETRPGVMVQFWRLSTGKSLKTSTRGSVMVPAQEPGPGGPDPVGNAPAGGLSADEAEFDATLNTPGAQGPLSPVLPARTARTAIGPADTFEDEPETGVPALVSPAARFNAHGRKVRPSDPTRSQATRIAMINDMVDGARLGSNAPKQAEAAQARPSPAQPGNPVPPTRPARRPAAAAPRKPIPRASFD